MHIEQAEMRFAQFTLDTHSERQKFCGIVSPQSQSLRNNLGNLIAL